MSVGAFVKKLQLVGTGYRAAVENAHLILNLGFAHPVRMEIPQGIAVKVEANTKVSVLGYDKCAVGQFSAAIRAWRPPEPYKGKGIRMRQQYISANMRSYDLDSFISEYTENGWPHEALECFEVRQIDSVTFVGIITACCNAGAIGECIP